MDLALLLPYLLMLLMGIAIGGCLGYLYLQHRRAGDYIDTDRLDREYVHRAMHEQLRSDADLQYENLQEKAVTEMELRSRISELTTEQRLLGEKLQQQEKEMERLQQASVAQFERTAERLFREKSDRFTQQNKVQLDGILSPLKERLTGFEQQIERRFLEETRDRITLREEIKHLQSLNMRISDEANNLAGALRGNTKTQGDWGEWQLLTLLEASGLQQGVHFEAQASYVDDNGRQKRPDFVINLPEDKHLVVDSKVSLTAYERYSACPAEDHVSRKREAALHLQSLRRHVNDLASKNYTRLYQINSPDYLLLFVPIEPTRVAPYLPPLASLLKAAW